jgi:hypothetical protein
MEQKRRSAADMFKWAAFLKKKEEEEQARSAQKVLKVARVSVVFLVIVNSILAIDVFLMPGQVKQDKLDYISSYVSRAGRGGGGHGIMFCTHYQGNIGKWNTVPDLILVDPLCKSNKPFSSKWPMNFIYRNRTCFYTGFLIHWP